MLSELQCSFSLTQTQMSLLLSKTPLHMTAYSGKQVTVRLLLDTSADFSTFLQTLLHIAAYSGEQATVQLLLDAVQGFLPFATHRCTSPHIPASKLLYRAQCKCFCLLARHYCRSMFRRANMWRCAIVSWPKAETSAPDPKAVR